MKSNYTGIVAWVLLSPVAVMAAENPPGISEAVVAQWNVPAIEINQLIAKVAKRTGKQFIVDPRVRAEVPLTGLDVEHVDYEKLLAILAIHQYAAIPSAGAIAIIPDANARQFPSPVMTEVPAKVLDNEYVTVILQGKNVCSAQTVPILRPMMPQAAHLAAMTQTNSLIVVDRAVNVRRIADLFERLDRAAPAGQKCTPDMFTSK
jgi:general secretion pathway protein D